MAECVCVCVCVDVQGEKAARRRLDSVEDPAQSVSLLNAPPHYELDDYGDDASLQSDAGAAAAAVAETALDSPRREAPGLGGPGPTTSGWRGPATAKDAPLKLPLDQTDYLQPRSSLPATYLDLVGSPGNQEEPDLQNILRHCYDHLAIMQKSRSTYDGRLIYQTSCEERKAFLMKDFLARIARSSEIVIVY